MYVFSRETNYSHQKSSIIKLPDNVRNIDIYESMIVWRKISNKKKSRLLCMETTYTTFYRQNILDNVIGNYKSMTVLYRHDVGSISIEVRNLQ